MAALRQSSAPEYDLSVALLRPYEGILKSLGNAGLIGRRRVFSRRVLRKRTGTAAIRGHRVARGVGRVAPGEATRRITHRALTLRSHHSTASEATSWL